MPRRRLVRHSDSMPYRDLDLNDMRDLSAFSGPLPLVSVIVATHGQLNYTQDLVKSLARHAGCDYELILVDNGCPEGTAEWAEGHGLKAIRMGKNAGVPAAYNAGVEASKGEVIAVWNNDMLCHPNGLERLARWSYAKGLASQSGGVWGTNGWYLGDTTARQWSDYAGGCCLTAPRYVWEKVGGWDEAFMPSYSDDADFCMRARLAGFDWVFVPNVVTHFGQKTSGKMDLRETVLEHQKIIADRYLPLGLGQRILVHRWAATGDMLLLTPALRALKREAPLARLHVVSHPGPGEMLRLNPHVDYWTHEAQPARYTRIIQLDSVYETPQKEGTFEHITLSFCRHAGVEYDEEPYDLFLTDEEQAVARGLVPDGQKKRLVACGLRSGNRDKQNWTASGWLKLANSLPDDVTLVALDSAPCPALGGTEWPRHAYPPDPNPDDAAFYFHPRVLDLTGRTKTFREAAAVIQRCEAFVGVDSGLLHAAAAFGLPTVTLCAAAPAEARIPLTGRASSFEGAGVECFPCQYLQHCPVGEHCLDWVNPADVAATMLEYLDELTRTREQRR